MNDTYYVNNQDHRKFTGSGDSNIWNQIGKLQFDLCVEHGLKSEMKFIDIGCGSLRGGVHFVKYLANNYYGIDMHKQLIDAGLEIELPAVGLQSTYDNFDVNDTFNLSKFDTMFDMGLAQSVFTHLPLPKLIECLVNIHPFFVPRGKFIATLYTADNSNDTYEFDIRYRLRPNVNGQPLPIDTSTYKIYDPQDHNNNSGLKSFIFPTKTVENAVEEIGALWKMTHLGPWQQHPRGPSLYVFEKVL